MKKLLETKWFFPFSVVLFLFIIALGVQLSYSAYIHRSYVKAVIATNETEKLFASNLLYGVKNVSDTEEAGNDWVPVRPFTRPKIEESIQIPIQVYNYLMEDNDRINQLDVSYTVSFQVTGTSSVSGYELQYGGGTYTLPADGNTYYLGTNGLTVGSGATQVLAGRVKSLHTYTITIPGADLNKVTIVVKAKRQPNNESGNFGTDLKYLAAKVIPTLTSEVQASDVRGYWAEQEVDPSNYTAYNYIIDLSGVETKVVLSWNNALLELDPLFATKHGKNGEKPELDRAVFTMDPGVIMVQFYCKDSMTGKSWSDLDVQVQKYEDTP